MGPEPTRSPTKLWRSQMLVAGSPGALINCACYPKGNCASAGQAEEVRGAWAAGRGSGGCHGHEPPPHPACCCPGARTSAAPAQPPLCPGHGLCSRLQLPLARCTQSSQVRMTGYCGSRSEPGALPPPEGAECQDVPRS